MAKIFISKRVIFSKKGMQAKYILDAYKLIDVSWGDFANKLGINQRTLRDWVREKFNISHSSLVKISEISGLSFPESIKIIDLHDHLKKISFKGGKNNLIKNKNIGGSSENRIKKWKVWFEMEGREKMSVRYTKTINIPERNEDLAEFVGIMLGDGGIAPYHISITLNSNDEVGYSLFIKKLIKKLFDVEAKIYKRKNKAAIEILVHRKKIVAVCEEIGLKIGHKIRQKVIIPDWILSDDRLTTACLRGLFDTDGSIYIHSYYSKNKKYEYTKVGFSGASIELIDCVRSALIKKGFYARIGPLHNFVYIESQKDVKKFLLEIGTSNPKNFDKLDKFWKRGRVVEGGTVLRC